MAICKIIWDFWWFLLWLLWLFIKLRRPVTCDQQIDLIGTVLVLGTVSTSQPISKLNLPWWVWVWTGMGTGKVMGRNTCIGIHTQSTHTRVTTRYTWTHDQHYHPPPTSHRLIGGSSSLSTHQHWPHLPPTSHYESLVVPSAFPPTMLPSPTTNKS